MLPTPKAKIGRMLLVFVFVQWFLVLVLAPPGVVYLHGVDDLGAPVYRKIFTAGFLEFVVFGSLGYMMWMGFGWARWVSSFLLFAISFIVLALYVGEVKSTARLALIATLIYQLILAAFLAASASVEQFIREQERNRRLNS